MLRELLGQPSSRLEFHDKDDLGLSPEVESAVERLDDGETGSMEVEEVEGKIVEEGEVGKQSSKDVDCETNDRSANPGAIYEMERSMGGSESLIRYLLKKRKAEETGLLSESEPTRRKRCHSV